MFYVENLCRIKPSADMNKVVNFIPTLAAHNIKSMKIIMIIACTALLLIQFDIC